MEVEFLKNHNYSKKGDVTLVTNDLAKDLIKRKIARATGENKFIEKESKMIAENSED